MEKVSKIFNSWWFRSSVAGLAGIALFISGEKLFSGIAFGIGIRELFIAFKPKPKKGKCKCGPNEGCSDC